MKTAPDRLHTTSSTFKGTDSGPRKGIPNPFIKEWWEDDEHYEQVNVANPKRLSVDQRKEIYRLHSEGVPVSEIKRQVGALNEKQVQNFLSGKKYKRGAVKVD